MTTIVGIVLLETTIPALLPEQSDVNCHALEMLLRTRHAAAWRVAVVMSLRDASAALNMDLSKLAVPYTPPAIPAEPNADQSAPGSP